jgi:hypothetical protein
MTIDERLDRLAERHEALVQSVELIAHLQRQNEESIGALAGTVGALAVTLEKNQILMAEIMESVNGLSRIALSHEQRLSDVEIPGRKPS